MPSWDAALEILHAHAVGELAPIVIELAVVNGFEAAIVAENIAVVEVRKQPAAVLAKWQAAVAIEKIRLVTVDEVLDAVEPLPLKTSRARHQFHCFHLGKALPV